MDEFEGFKNSSGKVIYSPCQFVDLCQNFFLEYSYSESSLIHLRAILYVRHNDSEYVNSAVTWALSQLGIDEEIQQRISGRFSPCLQLDQHSLQELLTTIHCYLDVS